LTLIFKKNRFSTKFSIFVSNFKFSYLFTKCFFLTYQSHFLFTKVLHGILNLNLFFVTRKSTCRFFSTVPGNDFFPKILYCKSNVSNFHASLGKWYLGQNIRFFQLIWAKFQITWQNRFEKDFRPIFRHRAQNLPLDFGRFGPIGKGTSARLIFIWRHFLRMTKFFIENGTLTL